MVGRVGWMTMSNKGCPACGAPLVMISINVGAGERIMCSCGRCDQRWWQSDGRLVTLEGVIGDFARPEAPRTNGGP